MQKVKVLFFSADPKSIDGSTQRLLLDEDVRQIREKVRTAEYRDALEFHFRPAARADDLLQALNEVRPRVVHFSGHGDSAGLLLMSADGKHSHVVDAEVLRQLFQVFRGDIQLVVLNACLSLPQAEAIAEAVGCAIGTRGEISDKAAITFGASFYRAVAFGHSVQTAYDQALLALRLERPGEVETLAVVAQSGVDPAALVLVPGDRVEHAGYDPAADHLQGEEFWRTLLAVVVRLYPGGPQDDRVWQRAGGDPSRLPTGVNGRTAWFDAVALMRNGGGNATAKSLLHEMRGDYPQDPDVSRLVG